MADLRKQADMKTVFLHGKKAAGRAARVDDSDYELVMAHRWSAVESRGTAYAITNIPRDSGGYRSVLMHSLITGWPRVDHADHDGLNNQRFNLRPATLSQNSANRKISGLGSSRYKGVCWHKVTGRWMAYIRVNRERFHLGLFDDEEEAARAYDAAAIAAWDEFAWLNFPAPPN